MEKSLEYLLKTSEENRAIHDTFLKENKDNILESAKTLALCFKQGGKVVIFGNGGSAADAQHMAAEMVGKLMIDRRPLPAIALTTDTSGLTALGNDFGFDSIFEKQVVALVRPGDVVIALSTSGKSKNVLLGVEAARKQKATIIALTGSSGGPLARACDISLNVSLAQNSSRTQEAHIFAIHSIVDLLDRFYLDTV